MESAVYPLTSPPCTACASFEAAREAQAVHLFGPRVFLTRFLTRAPAVRARPAAPRAPARAVPQAAARTSPR
ncbi:hypothetical protein C1I98_31695 [Spongiactinospora gelatinilytica]|uniref:Uncharacterized protein n=1 Tax=Spongiactinospora gelatinilytica TaxID=2666298 RepID=A0A2W2GS70_9ACTN|nr:hypothetical protein C1I98_31695 [Spongiactinospora gelatinilytica]